MLKPRALEPGDRVAIVAPASPFIRDEFDQGIEEVRRLGFEPVYDDSVFARQRYVAGPPELRAAAIGRAWRDSAIKGLFAARGGYGSGQLLPLLDREEARAARKPFIGYSDLTSILTFLTIACDAIARKCARLRQSMRSRRTRRKNASCTSSVAPRVWSGCSCRIRPRAICRSVS